MVMSLRILDLQKRLGVVICCRRNLKKTRRVIFIIVGNLYAIEKSQSQLSALSHWLGYIEQSFSGELVTGIP